MASAAVALGEEVSRLLAYDPEALRGRFRLYARLREEAPAFWAEPEGALLVTRYSIVRALYRETESLHATSGLKVYAGARVLLSEEENRMADALLAHRRGFMAALDGVSHRRIRAAAQPAFGLNSMRELAGDVHRLTCDLLDEFERQDEPDVLFVSWHLPIYVIMDLLGAPRGDALRLKKLSDALAGLTGWASTHPWLPERIRAGYAAMAEFREYMTGLVEDNRLQPRENFTSVLVAAADAGRLDEDELFCQLEFLIAAGLDAPRHMIARGILELLTQRDQWDLLCAEPALVPSAVEELTRFHAGGITPLLPRQATRDLVIEGTKVPEGATVLLVNEAANRDPEVFEDPERFDISRKPNPHLGFGLGAHFCLGAPMARLEGEIFFREFTRRYPHVQLAVDPDEVELVGDRTVASSLPVLL
jgi:cytochrome P450